MNKRQLTVLDLFSGCGGMSWGLHKAGFKVVGAIDIWKRALETFQLNHPDAKTFHESIDKLSPRKILKQLGMAPGDLDCIVGGPPCQGFSKNVPASGRFFEDPRNLLFRDYLDFVAALRPRVILMENVAEIYNAYNGAVRDEICQRLSKLGYQTTVKVLYAPDYGVPQRRRRCIFIGSRTGITPEFPEALFADTAANGLFGPVHKYRSAWECISDLPILKNGERAEPAYYTSTPQNDFQKLMRGSIKHTSEHVTRELREKQYSRISSLAPGQAWRNLPKHLQPKSGFSGAYGRLDKEMIAPTITRWVFHPGSGRFSHPVEPRLLTIREVARIQTFSDDFRFTGTYIEKAHQLGNAVPPLLMYALAGQIKACAVGARRASKSRPPLAIALA